jgi:hypothetical protein
MVVVYTREGEFNLAGIDEVRRLLRAHRFTGDGDYFTVGRDGIDYLEVYRADDGFVLAYIAADADTSRPIGEEMPLARVEQVLTAFLRGDPDWMSALEQSQELVEASAPAVAPPPIHAEAMHDRPEPIHPKAFGCFSFAALVIVAVVLLTMAW